MLSDYSLKTFRYSIMVLGYTLVIPYYWDARQSRVRKFPWYLSLPSSILTVLHLLIITYGTGQMCSNTLTAIQSGADGRAKLVIGFVTIFLLCLFIAIYLFLLSFGVMQDHPLIRSFNACLLMSKQLGISYNLSGRTRDGLERFLGGLVTTQLVILSLTPVSLHFILTHQPKLFSKLNQEGNRGVLIPIICYMCWNLYNVMGAWLISATCCWTVLVENRYWLRKLVWKENRSRIKRIRTRRHYRMLQLLHNLFKEGIRDFLPILIGLGAGTMSVTVYYAIKIPHGYSELSVILVLMGAIVFGFERFAKVSSDMIEVSRNYPVSYRRARVYLSRLDLTFFRACPPLEIRADYLFLIERHTFPIFIGLVCTLTVNLLVTF